MNATNATDADVMRAALGLARRGLGVCAPNPAVGCILMNDGLVVGRGWTQPGGRPHAEAVALAQAGAQGGNLARGATAYVTLEPCAHHGKTPPCAQSLVTAGVSRVVSAITDPDPRVAGKGYAILRDAGVEVVENVLRDEAWRANLGFFKRITEGLPQITLKLATSHDGLIPPKGAQGNDKWITSPAARLRGHLMRANHDAILFGIGTVLDDDPDYTCRIKGLEARSPIRVVLDSQLKIPAHAKLLQNLEIAPKIAPEIAPVWVICGNQSDPARKMALENDGVLVITAPDARPDVAWVAGQLADRGINRLMVETGPELASAFLNAGLVDDIAWFRASKSLGPTGAAPFHDFSLEKLALRPEAVLQAGPDLLELYHLRT